MSLEKLLDKIASRTVLHDQVDVGGILIGFKVLNDGRMIESVKYVNFAFDLVSLAFRKLGLVDDFYSYLVAAAFAVPQKDLAVNAASQRYSVHLIQLLQLFYSCLNHWPLRLIHSAPL